MNREPLEVKITLTEEQAEYIRSYLGYPIIPTTKDFQVVTSISDQIASSVQKAILNNEVKQKAHSTLEKIARIIIAKRDTGKEAFSKQEWKNILRRMIKVTIVQQKLEHEPYYRLVFGSERPYYVVKFTPHVWSWEIWEMEETRFLPWFDCDKPAPFLRVSEDALSYM